MARNNRKSFCSFQRTEAAAGCVRSYVRSLARGRLASHSKLLVRPAVWVQSCDITMNPCAHIPLFIARALFVFSSHACRLVRPERWPPLLRARRLRPVRASKRARLPEEFSPLSDRSVAPVGSRADHCSALSACNELKGYLRLLLQLSRRRQPAKVSPA